MVKVFTRDRLQMNRPAFRLAYFFLDITAAGWLTINIVLRLQTLHVFFQVGPVGIIGHARESGLHLLDGFVEVALAAINAGQTEV